MDTVANYIIRIYRCEKDRPQSLVGIVEETGKKGKKAFQSYDELWDILNSPQDAKHPGGGEGGDQVTSKQIWRKVDRIVKIK
jgi:hypothetical protein